MAKTDKLSIYLSFLLRHKPEDAGLPMDKHGWVSVEELIDGINRTGKYKIDGQLLCEIVKEDKKGRYRYNEDGTRIKACQGHSIPWVEPELTMMEPPEYVYHGTTTEAWEKIMASGAVNKMSRHAVHTQADVEKARAAGDPQPLRQLTYIEDAEGGFHKAGEEEGGKIGGKEHHKRGLKCIKII